MKFYFGSVARRINRIRQETEVKKRKNKFSMQTYLMFPANLEHQPAEWNSEMNQTRGSTEGFGVYLVLFHTHALERSLDAGSFRSLFTQK